jgi:NADH-quinone oxidoreductase subunit F
MSPDDVINEVKKSALRGRGGAGFPTGMKWSFVPKDSPSRNTWSAMLTSQPGTFKDRYLMERDPHNADRRHDHRGICAGRQNHNYIYTRANIIYLIDIMDVALDEARAAGLLGDKNLGTRTSCQIHTHTGARRLHLW